MAVYLVLYCLIALFGVYTFYNRNRPDKCYVWGIVLMTVAVTAVIAMRHPSMGIDLQYGSDGGYLGSYHKISELSFRELLSLKGWQNYEWGYILFNKFLSCISDNEQVLLAACAMLSILPIGLLIGLYSRDYCFSMLVYLGLPCFLITFSGLRQGIAIGICCLSYPFIKRKKWIPFLLLVFLAWLFHSSSILFLVVYPLYHLKLKKWQRLLGIPVLVPLFLLRYRLFDFAVKLLGWSDKPDYNNSYRLFLVFVLVYLFCVVFWNKEDEESGAFLNLFYLACVVQCFGGVYSIAMRFSYLFMIPLAIALPNIVDGLKDKKYYALFRFGICGAFLLFGLYSLYNGSWAQSYPYHFFWQTVPVTGA